MPPVPDGMISEWLSNNVPDPLQGWILDPFGASPRQALEMARAGYRVLVAANNPISRFLIEMGCLAPDENKLQAALAELASTSKGDERLEGHIRSLYKTECARCEKPIMADAFLWERDANAPYARLYTCPHCKHSSKSGGGEIPTNASDSKRAAHFIANSNLHHSRALERVAPLHSENREHVEEALSTYLPRAVYTLFTLINKLASLNLSVEQRDLLTALLLTTCDAGNTLWAYPSGRERPLQLVTPPRFRENNLWLALEEAVQIWADERQPIPITLWPDEPPPSGGICIFDGRLKKLASELRQHTISAVAAAFPRPNQAYWTLCALWAGWLWGNEAIGPFASVLQRRRYDWTWHTNALSATLNSLAESLPVQIPFLGLLCPVETGFLSAAMIAANNNGFDLSAISLREETDPAVFIWERTSPENWPARHPEHTQRIGLGAAIEYLTERGEPASHLPISTAALAGMAEQHCFRTPGEKEKPDSSARQNLAERYTLAQSALREILTYRGGFLRYNVGEALESGLWWLRDQPDNAVPLTDRVEMAVVNYLVDNTICSLREIDAALCKNFPGLLTPNRELIQLCLESYAEEDTDGRWTLRSSEKPTARREDLTQMRQALKELAERLNLTTEDLSPLRWISPDGQTSYWFHPKASAMLSGLLLNRKTPPQQTFIVIPGSRANLIAYKLRHDPRLSQAIQHGYRFLKFRHLRALLDRVTGTLSPEALDEQLNADPLTYTAPQMRLF